MNRFLGLALLALLVAVPVHAQMTVRPVIVEIRNADSDQATRLWVRNESDEPLPVNIYAGDFEQAASGDQTYFATTGIHAKSCDERISVFPDGATVPPGGEEEVLVRMDPGQEVCWSMVFVETRSASAANLTVGRRIGIKVYGVPDDATRDAEITRAEVIAADSTVRLEMTVQSTGTAPLRPSGKAQIRTPTGDLVRTVEFRSFSVLPGRERHQTVDLGSLDPGAYVLVTVLDISAPFLVGDQTEFVVP